MKKYIINTVIMAVCVSCSKPGDDVVIVGYGKKCFDGEVGELRARVTESNDRYVVSVFPAISSNQKTSGCRMVISKSDGRVVDFRFYQ
jgi:hypothetical protein